MEGVSWVDCTPPAACRAGRRRGPSPACGRGDVRACFGAPSALRAYGIAFAPAPSLHQEQGAEGVTLPEVCHSGKITGVTLPGGNRRRTADKGKHQAAAEAGNRRGAIVPGGGQGKSRAACGSFEIRVKIEADKKYNKITLSSPRTWGCFLRCSVFAPCCSVFPTHVGVRWFGVSRARKRPLLDVEGRPLCFVFSGSSS